MDDGFQWFSEVLRWFLEVLGTAARARGGAASLETQWSALGGVHPPREPLGGAAHHLAPYKNLNIGKSIHTNQALLEVANDDRKHDTHIIIYIYIR